MLAKLRMRAIAIVVLFAQALGSARATTLQQLSIGEIAEKATAIVRARIIGASGVLRNTDVYTIYQFLALEVLKAGPGGAPREVAVPGGIAGGIRQVTTGAPSLRPGREYVLFLWTGRSGLTQLVGLSQGLLPVDRTPDGVMSVSRPAAAEPMLDAAGQAVRGDAISLPWASFKSKIAAAAGVK